METMDIFHSSIVTPNGNLLKADPSSIKDNFICTTEIIVNTERNLECTGRIPRHQNVEEEE